MANYNILMNRFNGTTHDTLLPKNSLEGTSNPTTSTVGIVGQFYLNITKKRLWQCTNVNGSVYTWGALYHNKNLLDNAWFPCAENQRGQTTYTGNGYTADRWVIEGNQNNDISVTYGADGVTITSKASASNVQFIQKLADLLPAGTVCAGSVEVVAYSGTPNKAALCTGQTGSPYNSDATSIYSTGIFTVKRTIADVSNREKLYITFNGACSVTIRRAKLELGSVSTLHLDTPPSPAEQELNRQVCQRYYQRIDSSAIFTGTNRTASQCVFTIPYLVKMRTAPTVSTSSTAITYFANSTATLTLTSLTTEGDGTVLVVTTSNSLGNPMPVVIKFNSPIILSADL